MAETFERSDYPEIREAVVRLCAQFPGEYWRELDRENRYPSEFVNALTEAGYLVGADPGGIRRLGAAAVGGRRDPRGGPARRLQRRRLPRPDVHDGHGAPARLAGAEAEVPARDRRRAPAAPGLRRHRADLRHRHDGAEDDGAARGQRCLRRQRPEDLDLARRAFGPDAAPRPHDAGRSGEEAHRGAIRVPRRHARGARKRPDDPADPHDDEPRDDRGVLRRSARAGREPDRRGGQGLPLHPLGHERRAHPDRRRVHRRREWFVERATSYAKERVVFGRPIGQNQGVQFPIARAHVNMRGRRAHASARRSGSSSAASHPGAEANMAKLLAADASWEAANVASRRTAASASPRNTTSSGSSARRGSIRWRRSRRT